MKKNMKNTQNQEAIKKCNCDENCTCGCNDGKECTCEGNCSCGCNEEKCTCEENCECGCNEGKECTCEESCDCEKHENKKNKKSKAEIEKLLVRIKELEDLNLREKAESINFRKRKEEEVSRILKFCNEDLIREILPTIDNFERAIKMDDTDLTDEVSKFLAGIKMIYCNLVGTLEKYGVKAIDGANKPFDPTYHQAVLMEKREGVEPGMVLEVLQKGYLLKDRVIRPAMVRVSE